MNRRRFVMYKDALLGKLVYQGPKNHFFQANSILLECYYYLSGNGFKAYFYSRPDCQYEISLKKGQITSADTGNDLSFY